jgi:hypothetical protein
MRAAVASYWLELRLFARSMPKMKNLNQTPTLMDSIVDNDRAVDQFTDPRPLLCGVSHARKPAEQIDVIQQSLAKAGGGLTVVSGDVPHDLGQIA